MLVLCKRTNCLYKKGETIEGFYCCPVYTGKIPNTGKLVCLYCNRVFNEKRELVNENG